MMPTTINKTVLMSGADYFDVVELNPYSHNVGAIDRSKAQLEFASVRAAIEQSGIEVIKVDPPEACQDGIFTANWALCRGNTAILASLPTVRQPEQAYAKRILQSQGKTVIEAPYRFSGQGDALPCGNYLLMGTGYRNDQGMHHFVEDTFGYTVISLQTVPELDKAGHPVTNAVSGWLDSFFYDIDLALSVITPDLIAWCPEAFTPESQAKILALPLKRIVVDYIEAVQGFACNLVSSGHTVVMSAHAPRLQADLKAHGLRTITPEISELAKGGGYIRCTTLTLDNPV